MGFWTNLLRPKNQNCKETLILYGKTHRCCREKGHEPPHLSHINGRTKWIQAGEKLPLLKEGEQDEVCYNP